MDTSIVVVLILWDRNLFYKKEMSFCSHYRHCQYFCSGITYVPLPCCSQVGKAKIFLRAGQMAELDARRAEVLGNAARAIQRQFRTCIARKKFRSIRNAAIVLQSFLRGIFCTSIRLCHSVGCSLRIIGLTHYFLIASICFHHLEYNPFFFTSCLFSVCSFLLLFYWWWWLVVFKVAVYTLLIAGEIARIVHKKLKIEAAALRFQKNFRRYIARKSFVTIRSSAIVLQTGFRAMIARNEFRLRRQTKAAIVFQVYHHIIFIGERELYNLLQRTEIGKLW